MAEEIIGKINGVNMTGFTTTMYNLVFTDRRIVGEVVGGTAAAFLVGGAIGATIAAARQKKKSEGMKEENPEEILSKDRRNFSIEYMDIDEIQLKKNNVKIILNQKQKIVGRKAVFIFPKNELDNIESVFMRALPNKTVMKYKR